METAAEFMGRFKDMFNVPPPVEEAAAPEEPTELTGEIIVLGSSGNVGKATLAALSEAGVAAVAGVRDSSSGNPKNEALLAMESVMLVDADMSKPSTLGPAIKKGSAVFIAVPGHVDRTALTQAAINAAVESKAGHIVVVSLPVVAVDKNTIFGDQFKDIEESVKGCGIPFTLVRLPMFMDNNLGQPIKDASGMFMPIVADQEMSAITVKDIGCCVANVLKEPAAYAGRTLNLGGARTTMAATAQAFSEVLGRTISYTQVPPEAAKASMLGSGWPEWMVDGVLELMVLINEGDPSGLIPEGEDHTVEVLGRPVETAAEFMGRFKDMFNVPPPVEEAAAPEEPTEPAAVETEAAVEGGLADAMGAALSEAMASPEAANIFDPSYMMKKAVGQAKQMGEMVTEYLGSDLATVIGPNQRKRYEAMAAAASAVAALFEADPSNMEALMPKMVELQQLGAPPPEVVEALEEFLEPGESLDFEEVVDVEAEAAAAEATEGEPEPSPEDIELCSKPSIDRSVKIDELCRLLGVFKDYPNQRFPAKPEVVLVDKVVMAVRGCSSVIKARQDAAVAAGAAPLLVAVLTGPHLKDRETCLRTAQCLLGIMGKNEGAVAAFREAGCKEAMEGVLAQGHKDDSPGSMAKALALFDE